MAKHRWSEADDIAALYVFRFGVERLRMTMADLARSREITPGSFDMRVRNFGAMRGKGHLTHAARQSRRVLERYGDLAEEQLRTLVMKGTSVSIR
jgi:hypothetical protein